MTRTLVISDIHINDPRLTEVKTSRITRLLMSERYDKVVLNGDVVDLWVEESDSFLAHPIVRLLEEIAVKTPVVWVIGNHDEGVDNYFQNSNIVFCHKYETPSVVFIHGHQLDLAENKWWYARLVTKWNLWCSQKLGFDVQLWWHSTKFYAGSCHSDRRNLLDAGYKQKTIVIGHTHKVGHQFRFENNTLGQEIFDIGSLMELGTYGILDGDEISLRKIDFNE